jgi:hypothetical protein
MLDNHKNSMCEFAEELVSYLYDELSGPDKARFETHLGGCSLCTGELSEFSSARSAVQVWRTEEFLPLIPPTIEIPYQVQAKTVENDKVDRSWFATVRALFTLSPAWTTAATAFAALVICVGLFLVMFSSLPEDNDVTVQTNKDIKVSPSPTTGNPNSNISNSGETNQNTGKSPKSTLVTDPSKDVIDPVKGSTVKQPPNQNVKNQVQPNKINKTPLKQPQRKAPGLLEDEDEDDSLRLSELLEGIGADD